MARGKPKGIRRKAAQEKLSIFEKSLVSELGRIADVQERGLIEGIRDVDNFTEWFAKNIDPYLFSAKDIRDHAGLVRRLNNPRDPLSKYVAARFPKASMKILVNPTASLPALGSALVKGLNRVIKSGRLFDEQLFSNVKLSPLALRLKSQNLQGEALERFNRLLLEHGYANQLNLLLAAPALVEEEILDSFKEAARNLDPGFFKRCADVVEWIQNGRPIADPIATKILLLLWGMVFDRSQRDKITSEDLVTKLSQHFPRPQDYNAKDVRDVAKGIGLKFPMSKNKLYEDQMGYLKRLGYSERAPVLPKADRSK